MSAVKTIAFTHRVGSADEVWEGVLDGTVRTSALILRQPQETQRRIRETFDRLVDGYRRGTAIELPVSVKLASAASLHRLTCDHLVTYTQAAMDAVFKALADPTRRSLLDELFAQDGQSLSALGERLPMTRFGVMKHLRVLEEAGLVTTRRRGREKLHFLNPVPIRLIHDRWVSKYAEPLAATLSGLKQTLEEEAHG